MLSLPLAIACIVALIQIRATVCGDPLIWASVEAQAEFKTKPDGSPGGECSLPSTFQMRADGSWLPSSEFDLSGNFDENCGISLHLTIPEEEPEGGDDLRSKIEELEHQKWKLVEDEDGLQKKKEEHETKMEMLKREKIQLDSTKENMKDSERERNALNKRKVDITDKRNSLTEKLKVLGITDLDSAIEQMKEKENMIAQRVSDQEGKNIALKEILNGVCWKIPTSLYLSITNKVRIPSGAQVYICHVRGPNYSKEIEEMWNSEVRKMEKKKKESEEDMKALESKELELKNEERMHREDMKKLENEKDDLDKKKKELASIRSKLEEEEARRNDVDAKKMALEGIKRKLGVYADEDFVIRTETSVRNKMSGVEKEIALSQELLRLYNTNECNIITDLEYNNIKHDVKHYRQNIQVCEPKYDDKGVEE